MQVILNVDAITPPLTGIGRYALELAHGLARHPHVDDVRYYSSYRWVPDPDGALRSNVGVAAVRRHVPAKQLAMRSYFWLRQYAFSHLVRRGYSNYLLHAPNYMLFRHDGPSVATLHDFSWVHYPEHHPRERIDIMRREMPKTYAQATCFITDSEFVKREAMEIAGLPAERIHVVPLGVDPAFAPMDAATLTPVLARHGLQADGYLLAVSTLEPRKNLVRLLEAFAALPDALRARYPLVLVGVLGWHTNAIRRVADPMAAAGEIRLLGYVGECDLPALYAGARAFAFVSLHEGFGLPALEAMACGTPVLCSDGSSLPELVGEAALQVDPLDVDAIRAGLAHVLQDDDWRALARVRGVERANRYTWERCVDETVGVYRQAVRA